MENIQKTDSDFIKKLFVRLTFDEAYTLEQIENLKKTDVIASNFFIDFDFSKTRSLDYIVMTEEDIFDRKDNPLFEFHYRIYLFYSSLSPFEREQLHNDYLKKCLLFDSKISFRFDSDNNKISNTLLKYCVRNSIMFFDEFDRSTGMLNVEYFLMTVDHYSNHFSVDANEIACFEDDEIYS